MTTIVAYIVFKKVAEAVYLHAVWHLPFVNCQRNPTVTYNFSDLQKVYSGNRPLNTKCQLHFYTHSRYQQVTNVTSVTIFQAVKFSLFKKNNKLRVGWNLNEIWSSPLLELDFGPEKAVNLYGDL